MSFNKPQSQEATENWYKFETKIRNIIFSIVGPMNDQIQQNETDIKSIRTDVNELSAKYSTQNSTLNQLSKMSSDFDDLRSYVREFEEIVKQKDAHSQESVQMMRIEMSTLKENIKVFRSQVSSFNDHMSSAKNEIERCRHFVSESKQHASSKIKETFSKLMAEITDLSLAVNHTKSQENYFNTNIQSHSKAMNEMSIGLANLNQQFKDHQDKYESMTFVIKDEFDTQIELLRKEHQMSQDHILGIEKELRATDNYLDKRLPYETMKIINEMLDYVVTSKDERKGLKEYMHFKQTEFKQIADKNSGWPDLDKNIVIDEQQKWLKKTLSKRGSNTEIVLADDKSNNRDSESKDEGVSTPMSYRQQTPDSTNSKHSRSIKSDIKKVGKGRKSKLMSLDALSPALKKEDDEKEARIKGMKTTSKVKKTKKSKKSDESHASRHKSMTMRPDSSSSNRSSRLYKNNGKDKKKKSVLAISPISQLNQVKELVNEEIESPNTRKPFDSNFPRITVKETSSNHEEEVKLIDPKMSYSPKVEFTNEKMKKYDIGVGSDTPMKMTPRTPESKKNETAKFNIDNDKLLHRTIPSPGRQLSITIDNHIDGMLKVNQKSEISKSYDSNSSDSDYIEDDGNKARKSLKRLSLIRKETSELDTHNQHYATSPIVMQTFNNLVSKMTEVENKM